MVAGLTSVGSIAVVPSLAQKSSIVSIDDREPGRAISKLIYGSNEIGTMDGGARSGDLDRVAGVTARRLGGNLMTSYNWVNNASNAGKDFQNANGAFLLDALGIPKGEWSKPGIVVETMHEMSLAMGAVSLVTVPIAGYVAADFNGTVPQRDAAPSSRFVPVRWSGGTQTEIDPKVANIPQFVRRLISRYGSAGTSRGIWGYALDNEPGLWAENHPRIVTTPPTIRSMVERSIIAATAIKAIDPKAMVFGPASWGATEMVNFQNAPDFNLYSRFGSFLAAYLDAFRDASERAGYRLLDALDIHWYAFSRHGTLYRSNDPKLARYILDAPRSLTEPMFREESWVSDALPSGAGEGVRLPLLPSLTKLTERWFAGTELAVTEFNYGGSESLAAGLATADALGRFGDQNVRLATHWGSIAGWLAEAYRLYRAPDDANISFGDLSLDAQHQMPGLVVYAARTRQTDRMQIIAINKTESTIIAELALRSGRKFKQVHMLGFDKDHRQSIPPADQLRPSNGAAMTATLPPLSARRFSIVLGGK